MSFNVIIVGASDIKRPRKLIGL